MKQQQKQKNRENNKGNQQNKSEKQRNKQTTKNKQKQTLKTSKNLGQTITCSWLRGKTTKRNIKQENKRNIYTYI